MISRDWITPLNLYGWEAAPPFSTTTSSNLLGNIPTPTPMATSMSMVVDNTCTQEPPQGIPHTQKSGSQEVLCQDGGVTLTSVSEAYLLRAAIEEVSSTSTLIEGEDILKEKDYETTVWKLAKVS